MVKNDSEVSSRLRSLRARGTVPSELANPQARPGLAGFASLALTTRRLSRKLRNCVGCGCVCIPAITNPKEIKEHEWQITYRR